MKFPKFIVGGCMSMLLFVGCSGINGISGAEIEDSSDEVVETSGINLPVKSPMSVTSGAKHDGTVTDTGNTVMRNNTTMFKSKSTKFGTVTDTGNTVMRNNTTMFKSKSTKFGTVTVTGNTVMRSNAVVSKKVPAKFGIEIGNPVVGTTVKK